MIEAMYWWDEAEKLRTQARKSEDGRWQTELLELAETCEVVAIEVEERATGG